MCKFIVANSKSHRTLSTKTLHDIQKGRILNLVNCKNYSKQCLQRIKNTNNKNVQFCNLYIIYNIRSLKGKNYANFAGCYQ